MRPVAHDLRHAVVSLEAAAQAIRNGAAGERRYLRESMADLRDAMAALEATFAQWDRAPAGLLVGPVEVPPQRAEDVQTDPPIRVAVPTGHEQAGKHVGNG